ncbi:uncharacterized protein loc101772290 [Stylonychia lemnae]|uniref:Uncharacterized protein loc101772290 n=1 Tax=Stylonychia lemnae TaxID=5949 RepID=A0A078B372_STYLE|nr:uncharacterized protein loc101772290 [Stylonychia lemnae]|eukprot:CDW87697.1 uncharacterized protein loc101772290 [Stylonychia lemnae]
MQKSLLPLQYNYNQPQELFEIRLQTHHNQERRIITLQCDSEYSEKFRKILSHQNSHQLLRKLIKKGMDEIDQIIEIVDQGLQDLHVENDLEQIKRQTRQQLKEKICHFPDDQLNITNEFYQDFENMQIQGHNAPTMNCNVQVSSASESKETYFWKENECVLFIKALHKYGKKWKEISNYFNQKRNQLQCRSHGQKYLKSLKVLLIITQRVIEGKHMPSDQDHIRIKAYEQDRGSVLKSFKSQKESFQDFQLNSQFFPRYLYNLIIEGQDAKLLQLTDKMKQINQAISNELSFYDQLKEAKKNKNEPLQKNKRPYSAILMESQTINIETIAKIEDVEDQRVTRRQKK